MIVKRFTPRDLNILYFALHSAKIQEEGKPNSKATEIENLITKLLNQTK